MIASEIMRQEREATMRAIDDLALSAEARSDVIRLWVAVQGAINGYVASEDREIDDRVVPETLRAMVNEFERVRRRLSQ